MGATLPCQVGAAPPLSFDVDSAAVQPQKIPTPNVNTTNLGDGCASGQCSRNACHAAWAFMRGGREARLGESEQCVLVEALAAERSEYGGGWVDHRRTGDLPPTAFAPNHRGVERDRPGGCRADVQAGKPHAHGRA